MDYACVPMMDPNFKYGTCADPWARPGHDSLGFDKGRISMAVEVVISVCVT